jgi:hypothetical protein
MTLGAALVLACMTQDAWATKIIHFHATINRVFNACSAVDGTFNEHAGRASCTKKNCDGKGGACTVDCGLKGANDPEVDNCVGITPRKRTVIVRGKPGRAGALEVLRSGR